MSYILEALKKMERQKQRDKQLESWVDDLTATSPEERAKGINRSRLVVVFSVLFGVGGILAGLLFLHNSQVGETNLSTVIQSESVPEGGARGVTLSSVRSQLTGRDAGKDDKTMGTSTPPRRVHHELIDLTNRYKLTSTGEADNRKYATIKRRTYHIGDEFMGMTITDIRKDRVYLGRKGTDQRYVISFRYKE